MADLIELREAVARVEQYAGLISQGIATHHSMALLRTYGITLDGVSLLDRLAVDLRAILSLVSPSLVTEGGSSSVAGLPAHVASATETEAQHSAGQQEHLRLAINGVKAALPVLYMLLDNEHNVDAWGILARIAALEAARDFAPQGVSALSSEPGAGGGIEGASRADLLGEEPDGSFASEGPCQSEGES